MHLVFLNQYYPPDVAPTGVMLEGLVAGLVTAGHEVTVLCAAGGYGGVRTEEEERLEGGDLRPEGEEKDQPKGHLLPSSGFKFPVSGLSSTLPRIIRIRACRFGRGSYLGKLLDYASFYLGAAWALLWLRPAPGRIVALTTPPYLSVLARGVSKIRGADHAHWVMDLYPDVMVAHGMLVERGLVHRLLSWLARWGMGGGRCAAVLTLGPDMAERVGDGRWAVGGGRLAVGEEEELAVGAGEEIVRSYSLDVIREEREDVNIEHRTSNIEHRTEEDCEGKPRHGSQAQQTTDNGQRTTAPRVEWVPLWGEGGERDETGDLNAGRAPASLEKTNEALTGMAGGNGGENVRGYSLEVIREEWEEDCVGGAGHGEQALLPGASDGHRPPLQFHRQPPTDFSALRRERGWGDEELVLMYSGNMGRGHRFEEILAAVVELGGGEEGVVKRDSLEVIQEERENANIEHRTLNVEHRTEEDCGGEPEHDAQGLPPDASETPVSETPVSETPASSVRMRFVFYGGGARKDEVERFARSHPQCAMEVHDYAPADRLTAHLQSADVHLASLDAAWTGTMVPSKLQGIFQAGRPVVFIGSAASSIGRWVLESGGGWVVPPGDVAGLLAALDEARDPEVRASRGRAAREFAVRNFDKATNVAQIISCLTAGRGDG